mmetsp:Transcript_9527/g.28662  ORF Transcript_9527/g.28662 Transcript_9527/m.28662 type:complete len:220 (+) Transcript_9527:248-907(+)
MTVLQLQKRSSSSSSASASASSASSLIRSARCSSVSPFRRLAPSSNRMALTASLWMSRQKAVRPWKAAAGSWVAYTSPASRHIMMPCSWSMLASSPPSLMTFATMLSASAALGTPSLAATSVREMREYAAPMRANPARSTFCRKRTTRLLVRSFAHQGLPSSATFLKVMRSPARTAAVRSKYGCSAGARAGVVNSVRSGTSLSSRRTSTHHFVTSARKA